MCPICPQSRVRSVVLWSTWSETATPTQESPTMTVMMMNMWYVITYTHHKLAKRGEWDCIFLSMWMILFSSLLTLRSFLFSCPPPPCSSSAGGSGGDGCRPHPEGSETKLRSSMGRSGRWIWEGRDVCPGVCTDPRRYAEVIKFSLTSLMRLFQTQRSQWKYRGLFHTLD